MNYRAFIFALTAFLCLAQQGQARSTFTARMSTPGIAGPGIRQVVTLYLHFFPGDGEAILRSEIAFDPHDLEVSRVVSRRGKGSVQARTITLDYAEDPIGFKGVDTLAITLQARRAPALTKWQGRIFSTVDMARDVAHTLGFQLAVEPPVTLRTALSPVQLFPGEKVDLQAVLSNADAAGRAVRQIEWDWPEGLVVVAGSPLSRWDKALASGAQDTLNWQVQVTRQQPGALTLEGRAGTDQLAGSPVMLPALEVLPVPVPRLNHADGIMEVGKVATFTYRWDNPAAAAIALESLVIEIPGTFRAVEVTDPPVGLSIAQPAGGESGRIRLEGNRSLPAGGSIELVVQARPERPGPFAWRSWFRPVGHTQIPLLTGNVRVKVAGPAVTTVDLSKEGHFVTDLEFISVAFKTAIERELNGFPLAPGARIRLQPEEKGDKNWVVDDVLTRALIAGGYVVTLKESQEADPKINTLHYRLADSRVIYSSVKKGWVPFRKAHQREARGNLFLQLTTEQGSLDWVAQVKAFAAENVDVENMELLGDSKIVERTVVEPEHKLVERGLSASIIGGLVVIFFAP